MMLDLQDIQNVIADSFLDGNVFIAGMIMFVAVLAIVFLVFKKLQLVLLISMPVALIFGTLGILTADLMILMIIVAVLGLATTARDSWRS